MNYASIRDVVLFGLAIYAAFLSTLNFFQARRKDRRSVRVFASTVMPTYGPEVGPPYTKIDNLTYCLNVIVGKRFCDFDFAGEVRAFDHPKGLDNLMFDSRKDRDCVGNCETQFDGQIESPAFWWWC